MLIQMRLLLRRSDITGVKSDKNIRYPPSFLPVFLLKTTFLKPSLEQDWEKTGRKYPFFWEIGSNGVKKGQMVSNGVKWCQKGSNGVKKGQLVSNGVKWCHDYCGVKTVIYFSFIINPKIFKTWVHLTKESLEGSQEK